MKTEGVCPIVTDDRQAERKCQRLYRSMMKDKTMTGRQTSHCIFLGSRMHAMKHQVGYRLHIAIKVHDFLHMVSQAKFQVERNNG